MVTREVMLAKDVRLYIFRYPPGAEERAVDEIMATVEQSNGCFDWFDAARLTFEVAEQAIVECP